MRNFDDGKSAISIIVERKYYLVKSVNADGDLGISGLAKLLNS